MKTNLSEYKVGLKIMPREVILDTQGRAVEQSLKMNALPVQSCRVGKYVELRIQASHAEEAKMKAEKMAKFVLHNPLIETYQLEVFES